MGMKLEMVQNSRLSKEIKGGPKKAEEKTLSEISSQGWSLLNGDLPLPVATLKQSAGHPTADKSGSPGDRNSRASWYW